MKNSTFLLFLAFSLSSTVSAQSQAFSKGTNIISAGLGFDGVSGGDAFNVHSHSSTPEYSLQYERGIWKAGSGVISLGVFVGEASYQYDLIYPWETRPTLEKWTYWELGFRGAYHFAMPHTPALDTYAGAMVSATLTHYTADSSPALDSYGRGPSIFAGARYSLRPHLAVYAELATAPFFNAGLAAKF